MYNITMEAQFLCLGSSREVNQYFCAGHDAKVALHTFSYLILLMTLSDVISSISKILASQGLARTN